MPEHPTAAQIETIAARLGYPDAADRAAEFAALIGTWLGAYDEVDALAPEPPDRPPVRHRTPTPAEDPHHAWRLRAEIAPTGSGALDGSRVAVKDSIMVAGLPAAAGSGLLADYQPSFDATVVTRVLDAGGTVVGKTHCAYLCLDGGSYSGAFGATHNPWRRGYSAGGSSSGSAVAIATGDADLALGTDQAGSIRVPASFCGVVGLKPTHGLVPYTGVFPLDPVIDHCGPMAATVADCARALGVLAGYDDYDPRQRRIRTDDYLGRLDAGARGLRVGVLAEGFDRPGADPEVGAVVRAAAADLAALGADVVDVSIPMHAVGNALWLPIVLHGMAHSVVAGQGFGVGRDDRYPVDAIDHLLVRAHRSAELPPTVTACALLAEYVRERHGIGYYARAVNAVRRLRRAYDDVLVDVDVLAMPTTPHPARPMPEPNASVAEYVGGANDMFGNTAPFNGTHHPAISLPCGESDGLPVGLMLVGRRFDEATVLRAAFGYEQRHH